MNSQIKEKNIVVRMSENDHKKINVISQKLGYNSMSKYVRDICLNPTVKFITEKEKKHYSDMKKQLSFLNNNLNQIVKKVHLGHSVFSKDVLENIKQIKTNMDWMTEKMSID